MAKPSPDSGELPRLLALELWGIGDLALAMPFLATASRHARVTLLAKPHAGPLLARFAPAVELRPLTAPWTAFTGKYRLHRWPWRGLRRMQRELRAHCFDLGVSARPDPRDHALLAIAGCRNRIGYPRAGSGLLLTNALPIPHSPHRTAYWEAIALHCGWDMTRVAPAAPATRGGTRGRVLIHTGAAQPARRWPLDRFQGIALRLRNAGWEVVMLDESSGSLEELLATLSRADRFIGNDSGPGHLAALLGVPTFTIFGPSLPERFSPVHPHARWIEGAACEFRPCWDRCRFDEPRCINAVSTDTAWTQVQAWLESPPGRRDAKGTAEAR